jgi:hypothetical protein
MSATAPRIPRDKEDDYTTGMAGCRREFLHEQTGASLAHVGRFSVDPGLLPVPRRFRPARTPLPSTRASYRGPRTSGRSSSQPATASPGR